MLFSRIGILLAVLCSFSASAIELEETHYEKAVDSVAQAQLEDAYIHLKNALNINPNHVPSKLLMGDMLYARGYFEAALQELKEAQDLGADENLTAVTIARSLLVLERYNEIISMDTSSFRKDIAFEIYLIKATAQLQITPKSDALGFIDSAQGIRPNSLRVLQSYGLHYLLIGNFTQSQQYIDKAVQSYGDSAQNYHLQGQLDYAKGNFPSAALAFEQALTFSTENPIVRRALANTYMELGKHNQALELAQKIVDQTPGDPHAKLLLGRLRAQNNQPDVSKQIFSELLAELTLVPPEIMRGNNDLQFVNAFASYLNKDYENAVKALEGYLLTHSNNNRALALLADTHIRLGDAKAALTLLDLNESNVLQNIPLTVTLCNLYIKNNRSFKCDSLLFRAEALHGKTATFDLVRVNALMEREKFEDAYVIFERTFEASSDEDLILIGIELKTRTERYTEALKDVKALYKTSTDQEKLILIESTVLKASGDITAALAKIEPLVQAEQPPEKALILYSELLLMSGKYEDAQVLSERLYAQSQDLEKTILLANTYRALGKNRDAIELLESAKKDFSGSDTIARLLLLLYSSSNLLDEAIVQADELLRRNRLDESALIQKAELLIRQGSTQKANVSLNILHGLWLDDARRLVQLSVLQRKANNFKGAETSLKEAQQLAPDSITVRLEIAKLKLKSGTFDDLASDIDFLVKNAPNSSVVFSLRGQYYNATNEAQKAFESFLLAYDLDPSLTLNAAYLFKNIGNNLSNANEFEKRMNTFLASQPDAHFHRRLLADFFITNKRYQEAEAHYRILAAVDNLYDKATVLNNLAIITISKDLEKALSFSEDALAESPNAPDLLDTHGWILSLQGKYEEALPSLRRAYSYNAVDPNIMYHLGVVLAKQGKTAQAKLELKNALASDLPFDDRAQAKALLQSLETP